MRLRVHRRRVRNSALYLFRTVWYVDRCPKNVYISYMSVPILHDYLGGSVFVKK